MVPGWEPLGFPGCHPSNSIISGLVGGLPSLGGWDPKRSPQLKRGSDGACLSVANGGSPCWGGWLGQIEKVGDVKKGCDFFFLWVILLDELEVIYLYVLHFSFEDACGRTNM